MGEPGQSSLIVSSMTSLRGNLQILWEALAAATFKKIVYHG
jgi:hypothetical protein